MTSIFSVTLSLKPFAKIIKLCSKVYVDSTAFYVSKDGIRIRFMDAAHVALIDVFIPKEFTSNYKSVLDEFKFQLRSRELLKILQQFKSQEISLSIEDNFIIQVWNQKQAYTFSYLEGVELIKLPKWESTCKIEFASIEEFNKGLKALSVFGVGYLHVKGKPKFTRLGESEFELLSESEPREKSSIYVKTNRIEIDEEIDALYSIEYLNELKHIDLKIPLKLFCKTGFPCQVSFSINGFCHFNYYLAPRVKP